MTAFPQARVVFTEIPVADPARACRFYETLLQEPLTRDDNGPNPIWMFPAGADGHPAGHLYPGKPAVDGEGMTAHLAVADGLDAAMERVRRGGGSVVSIVTLSPGFAQVSLT